MARSERSTTRRRRMADAERHHLATRFGLTLRPEFAIDGGRLVPDGTRTWQARALAWDVPYYALLHHGNVVPREALVQRGPMADSIAVDVTAPLLTEDAARARAEQIAAVLMRQFDAPGSIYAVRPRTWDRATGSGRLLVDAAGSRGGERTVEVAAGDLSGVLEVMVDVVAVPGEALVISKDPVDLRDMPTSGWRWVHRLADASLRQEFQNLHRRMSFGVLRALARAPEGSLRPVKSVPRHYVELPGGGLS